jgi:SAM-dependent methyltransferase
MKQAIDNFSNGSDEYARYRPESPAEIFDFLYARVNGFDAAWDCGTGNGQVAAKLANRFSKVYGTDISTEQLEKATQKDNIHYLLERAEQTSLPDSSINLITVAQAIHWFDFEKFYTEVRRAARPGAILAAWTYTVLRLDSAIDAVVDELYTDITGPYWDKERDWVDAQYSTIPFPFRNIETPVFRIERDITRAYLEGYLRTWSGVKHFIKKEGHDPVSLIADKLTKAWGNVETHRAIWPVHMRAGYVD